MKYRVHSLKCLAIALLLFAVAAHADEVPLVNGVHWTKSTPEQKKSYLIGMANLAQVELAYQDKNQISDDHSILPRMAKGLKGQTLDSVRQGVDRWYAANPNGLKRPVLDIIWFEMAVPGLQKK